MRKLLAGFSLMASFAFPDVRVPSLISDHMLLQRGRPVRIWGTADPSEPVAVSFAGQRVSTVAGAAGKWETWLAPLEANGIAADLTIQAKNTLIIRDVLVGDVWTASGQSNMVWEVRQSNNAEQEMINANFPQIRIFEVALKTSDKPLDDVQGSWAPVNPDSIRNFSGVGYYFARHLWKSTKVPVAVIQSAWGGTPVQAWTSLPVLQGDASIRFVLDDWDELMKNRPEAMKKYEAALKQWEKESASAVSGATPPRKPQPPLGPGHQHQPAVLYNAMIAPLVPYTIRGVIWYQGENNAGGKHAADYHRQFTAMIRDWRTRWGQGDFPFLWVQLANYARAGNAEGWSLVQEAQLKSLELRQTAMAVTIDVGNPVDIHPTDKQTVGYRLALAALHLVHGVQAPYSGPRFRQVTRESGALRIWFDSIGGGLRAKGTLDGFLIGGEDRNFHKAEAKIDGDTIVVKAEAVSAPVAVRYGWAADPPATLYNAAGLPASPFRSDNWDDAQLPR
jgi:sialate O-acetylesterase